MPTTLYWYVVCHQLSESLSDSSYIVGYNVHDAVASEIIAQIVFLSPRKIDGIEIESVYADIRRTGY